MSQRPASFLNLAARSASLVAVVLLASACGGQETAANAETAASAELSRTPAPTTNFVLTQVDGQTTPPLFACPNSSIGSIVLNSGALAITKPSYVVNFSGTQTQNGVTSAKTFQEKGSVTVSGTTYAFTVPNSGTYKGTLTNGVLTVTGYPYCGATHTLVYQQQ
jgi:hypothetical protein